MSRRTRRRGKRGIKSRRIAGVGSPKKLNTGLNTDLSALIAAITDVAEAEKAKNVRKSNTLKKQLKSKGTRASKRSSVQSISKKKNEKYQKELDQLKKNIEAFERASKGAPQIKAQKGKNTFGTAELEYALPV